jgi:membrane-associated protein
VTETLLGLVPTYGTAVIFLATGLGCFGFPIPGSIVLLSAGALVASGEMNLWVALSAGLAGAVTGDQAGYWLGARGGPLTERLTRKPAMAEAIERGRGLARHWGGPGVFFTRWLVSPLGPPLNLVGGLIGMGWLKFTLFEVAGEVVWVGLYVSLGFAFSRSIMQIADLSGTLAQLMAAAAVTIALALRVRTVLRHPTATRPSVPTTATEASASTSPHGRR